MTNLAQTSALLYHAYLSSPLFGTLPDQPHVPLVNWVGFYLHLPSFSTTSAAAAGSATTGTLTLGPYNGRPACVTVTPRAGKGVCADTYVHDRVTVVDDVEAYPGHIGQLRSSLNEGMLKGQACDGDTKSEVVLPLRASINGQTVVLGVFDLDSTALRTFNEEDRQGLERIVQIVADASEWS